MHLQPQRRKNRWRLASQFVRLDDAVVLSPSPPLMGVGKKKKGARGDLTSTSHQPNGPQTACHAVYATTGTELRGHKSR